MTSPIIPDVARQMLDEIAARRDQWENRKITAQQKLAEIDDESARLAQLIAAYNEIIQQQTKPYNGLPLLGVITTVNQSEAPAPQKLTTRDRIKYSALNGPKNIEIIMKELGITKQYANAELSRLVKSGAIERYAPGVYGPPDPTASIS